ncbi:MAG TPA: hypothetical protein VFH28_00180 [Nitrososphaera sp.]|nr:hypothetical protein [Nitrososphaera sp.]
MPTYLSTTVVSKISEVPNPVSAQIIREFYQYTRESNSSEKHMTNELIMTVVNDSMESKRSKNGLLLIFLMSAL